MLLSYFGALLVALLIFCSSVEGQSGIPDSSKGAWLALLHYWPEGKGWKSEVSDPTFFLDASGAVSPEGEWSTDSAAFLRATTLDYQPHAQCRFPARFSLMKRALGWTDHNVPSVTCQDVKSFSERLKTKSLSVVFVSYFLNNPASAFGHTMLYFGSATDRTELQDYSVSFEANTNGVPAIKYIPRGLTGGLIAAYRVAPFYERVRRYERLDQRDLWVFPLRLRQEEIDQLILHLWELQDARYKYGFFGENCAQKLLALVHAVAPRYALLPDRHLAALPAEVTRRLVTVIGLSGNPIYRPSLMSRYTELVAQLASAEQTDLEQMVARRNVNELASRDALTATLLWSEIVAPDRSFRRAADSTDHADLVWRRELWTALARTAQTEKSETRFTWKARPSLLESHRPSKRSIGGGISSRDGRLLAVGVRWLLHDAVDSEAGYVPSSTTEVGDVALLLSERRGLSIGEVTLLRIEKLAGSGPGTVGGTWRAEFGARRVAYHGDVPLNLAPEVSIGLGRASTVKSPAVYSMAGLRTGFVMERGSIRFLPLGLLSAGALLGSNPRLRARIGMEYLHPLFEESGGFAVKAVMRARLGPSKDIEAAFNAGGNQKVFKLGIVSFK